MSLLRRMHVRALFTETVGYEQSPLDEFREIISTNSELLNLIAQRLEHYARKRDETWRLVWVLYLCTFLNQPSSQNEKLRMRIVNIIDQISHSNLVDQVACQWAFTGKAKRAVVEDRKIEQIHDLEYLEAGSVWHGP